MDISKMSIIELKALAYDEKIKMELAHKNLGVIDNEIIMKQKAEQKEEKNENA